nr:HAD-IA family hydrolase [Tissierella sp.]
MKYDAVIYDLDGTVLNTFDMNIYPLMEIVKEELGVDMDYNELTPYTSIPGLKSLEILGIQNIPAVYERWVKYVNEYEGGAKVYYNFDEVIQSLDGKVTQAVVSSKKREQYMIDIDGKNLHDYFSAIVLLEDTENHKPHGEPLLHCAEILGVDPKRCLYIGDSLSDFQSAKNAGMDFAFAQWASFHRDEIVEPNYTLEKPDDLIEIVIGE